MLDKILHVVEKSAIPL